MGKQFWQNGIHFTCQQCGNCCQGEPGELYFSSDELKAVAQSKSMDPALAIAQFFLPFNDAYKAKTNESTQKCIFFDNGCTIYAHRPQQCRAYPFWRVLLSNKVLWERYAEKCPAMRTQSGRYYSPQEIVNIAAKSPL